MDKKTMAMLERSVFAEESAPGYLEHVGERRFHARNDLERSLLLHAFAHMPDSMSRLASLRDKTPSIGDDDILSWTWSWKNFDAIGKIIEPELRTTNARGYYAVIYNPETRRYSMRVIWDESRLDLMDGQASSTAIHIKSQMEMLKLIKAAKALGCGMWDDEREIIRQAQADKRQRLQKRRTEILDAMP